MENYIKLYKKIKSNKKLDKYLPIVSVILISIYYLLMIGPDYFNFLQPIERFMLTKIPSYGFSLFIIMPILMPLLIAFFGTMYKSKTLNIYLIILTILNYRYLPWLLFGARSKIEILFLTPFLLVIIFSIRFIIKFNKIKSKLE